MRIGLLRFRRKIDVIWLVSEVQNGHHLPRK